MILKGAFRLYIISLLLMLYSCGATEQGNILEMARTKGLYQITIAILVLTIVVCLFRLHFQQAAARQERSQKKILIENMTDMQKELLKEKEWLIKEVHHRVKNNLQMVTSLLYSQSVYQDDDRAKLALKDSLRRMQAMSMIHQRLYEDQNVSTLSMSGYISDLVNYLLESFEKDTPIIFEQQIDAVELDVSQAIPLGLILTESIVNSMKYAFISGQKGIIILILKEKHPGSIEMNISDNGNGFTIAPGKLERGSLGFELMHGLAKQLGGNIKIENCNGVSITVNFDIILNN